MEGTSTPPKDVVLDLVLTWTPELTGKVGTVAIVGLLGAMAAILFVRNHQGKFVQLQVPVSLDGETRDGSDGRPPLWVLFRIAPGVWKLSQSIRTEELHAYLTFVGVPEPAPWEKDETKS